MKKKIYCLLAAAITVLVSGCEEPVHSQNNSSMVSEEEEENSDTESAKPPAEDIMDQVEILDRKEEAEDPTGNTSVEGMEVHFIDVGQGDATLIRCGDQAMMIDFGNNDKGTLLQKYLIDQGIEELKYALGTHPDADHIGGMDVILYKFDTEHVWMPQLESDTATYRDVIDVCKEEGYEIEQPEWQKEYTLSDAVITVEGPVFIADSYSDKNEASIIVKVSYGDSDFLFCGDAPVSEETEMLENQVDLSAEVLKLGHHGSSTSSSDAFLDAVSPSYGVISCGLDNSYGHPHRETMDKLQNRGISVYRTDLQSTVIAKTDGVSITWSQDPSTDYRSGEEITQGTGEQNTEASNDTSSNAPSVIDPVPVTEAEDDSNQISYIINKNTKKFHVPGCSSVDQMKEENKEETTETKEQLEAEGYSPCKNCIGN